MKQLMVYVNPTKKWVSRFRREDLEKLARIQIDNSLRLGWKPQDIIVATNFPWEYNGVTTLEVSSGLYCDFRPLSTKTLVVTYLLEMDFLPRHGITWVHDWDAYQVAKFPDMAFGGAQFMAAFPTYGWSRKWALGSYFVKGNARWLMQRLRQVIYEYRAEDERALGRLVKSKDSEVVGQHTILSHAYNFGMRHIKENYERAEKPLRVLHFHPHYRDTSLPYSTLDAFMYGKSELGFPLMDEGLIEVFKEHGIE